MPERAAKAAVSCCSRPNLFEVSLPSPTLACLHARPKLPWLKSDQCSTPLLHVGFGVCFDVSVGLDYGDTGFKADVENTRRRERQHPVKSLPGNCSKTSANGPPPYAETSCQGTLTVFTRLNAADGSKITNKRHTQSEKFGVYSMIVRKKTRCY